MVFYPCKICGISLLLDEHGGDVAFFAWAGIWRPTNIRLISSNNARYSPPCQFHVPG